MSSSRPTRSSQQTPTSAVSKGKKKARVNEDPPLTPEDYIYRSGLCKNRFTQDFRDRKVIHGRWIDFEWFSANGFDFQDMFKFQGWETLVSIKENCYVYLVKLVFANFQFSKSEDADSYVNGKILDLSSSSLNSLANAPDDGKKFFENHGWVGLSEVDPLHILRILEVDLGGEVRVPPMDTREYNHKTLKLMGFQQTKDGDWIKKADATPQKRSHKGSASEAQSEDEEEAAFTRTPATRTPRTPFSPSPFPPLHLESPSHIPHTHSHEPNFESMEASFGDIKEEQRKLGQQLEKLSLDMKTGFDDIKELFAAHDERFNLLDKDVRLLKHQVNNSVRVATDVIQATVKDLKSSAQDVITATEVNFFEQRQLIQKGIQMSQMTSNGTQALQEDPWCPRSFK
ncbi:hypothetical protein CJ030_MR7G008161 [Morella rubra]|uniref:Uncharacterized protein n=1 Tax=Morella rubra TaxID=262757 RepID=A0A6A1V2Q4_9ROSI|nr:hypothetical protein CJ030_MR7G008161 [Morella rubra]